MASSSSDKYLALALFDAERERETETETDRQTDRQTDREREREREREQKWNLKKRRYLIET